MRAASPPRSRAGTAPSSCRSAPCAAPCAVIAPVVPAFYTRPKTLDDVVDYTVGRLLDLFDIDTGTVKRRKSGPAGETDPLDRDDETE